MLEANPEGNHGEDVKECYYYLDATPTASYLKALYKYPQAAFPYEPLLAGNRARSKQEPELWFRNTWSWKGGSEAQIPRPSIRLMGKDAVTAEHARL
ncbi:MAG TPA: hypothetical protein VEQ15_01375, partial [Myxococcales bacterium]|nr:hypothetical protein [Myxococcales bacterium]